MSFSQAEFKTIQSLHKITDTSLVSLPPVIMGNFAVVTCKEDDNVYLYTPGLGPCVGITARCEDKKGNIILGAAHMVDIDDNDFCSGISPAEISNLVLLRRKPLKAEDIDKILTKFQPFLLTNMINTMRLIAGPDAVIDICFGGGRGGVLADGVHTLLVEFVKRSSGLRLIDTAFNPYKFTKSEEESGLTDAVLINLETIIGITSKGEVWSITPIDIDIGKFNSDEEVVNYLSGKGISLPLEEMIHGFDFATYLKTSGNAHQFTHNVIQHIHHRVEVEKTSSFSRAIRKEGTSPIHCQDEKNAATAIVTSTPPPKANPLQM
ncbi:MAG: hypothetical protein ACYCQI_10425 [Gammaproteobacteria bacterium]